MMKINSRSQIQSCTGPSPKTVGLLPPPTAVEEGGHYDDAGRNRSKASCWDERSSRRPPGGTGRKVALAPANVFAWLEVISRAVAT